MYDITILCDENSEEGKMDIDQFVMFMDLPNYYSLVYCNLRKMIYEVKKEHARQSLLMMRRLTDAGIFSRRTQLASPYFLDFVYISEYPWT